MGEKLYQSRTTYNDIVITMERNIITLYSPSQVKQTAIDITNPVLPQLEYARNILLCLSLCPEPESILVIGLGGGSIPTALSTIDNQVSIDAVEIDPEIEMVAKKYFNFTTTDKLRLFIEDASSFIKNSSKVYDIIITDAFMGSSLPDVLSSTDFYREIKKHLALKGILVANLSTSNKTHFKKTVNKIKSIFSELWMLHGEKSDNTIVFAAKENISHTDILYNAYSFQESQPLNIKFTNLASRLMYMQGF